MAEADVTGFCCDTSVLVPALIQWHPSHADARAALARVTQLPAHGVLETFSVLTRLPTPHRLSARDATAALARLPFDTVALPAGDVVDLVAILGERGIGGGATYDALIGLTAARHRLVLLTSDRRAASTYDAVGARYEFV